MCIHGPFFLPLETVTSCFLTGKGGVDGGRPGAGGAHRGNCLESQTLSNKHSGLIVKKDAGWGSLIRLHSCGRGGIVVLLEWNVLEGLKSH